MSILSSRLSGSSGLGGVQPTMAYGGTSTIYPATSTGPVGGIIGGLSTGATDITSGRLTLAALEVLIVALVGFYIWTHKIQGGG